MSRPEAETAHIPRFMDKFTTRQRSQMMSRVKTTDTAPELKTRQILHGLGYRFRLNRVDLPGKPDIVLAKYRTVVFVHGCFWHSHQGCTRGARPSSNINFWRNKLDKNLARDSKNLTALKELGWSCLIVWECETRKPLLLGRRLERHLRKKSG